MRLLVYKIMSALYKRLYGSDFGKDAQTHYERMLEIESLKAKITFLEHKVMDRNAKIAIIVEQFNKVMKVTDIDFTDINLIRDLEITEIKKMFGGEK